ncbi:MAG: ribonuclease HII [Bacteroidia bacterium]|nr:ribonuclease HII [Bacteroidia bacterium]
MPLKGNSLTGVAEAGCDEAGRGCLAGPVVAAAVILPDDTDIEGLNDSKQLRPAKREELKTQIEKKARAWAVAFVHPAEIDEINILNASFLAMHRALDQLKIVPDSLLIDGNRFNPYRNIPHRCIVKGDASYLSIAAASILAKTYRDEYMEKIGREYPGYNWKQNKGYPTTDHREAIRALGSCIYHRKSFTLLPPQLKLDL